MAKVANAHKTILERRNRKMQISADRLKKIIIEEYIKEELLDESQAAQDLLRQILGDEEYERRQAIKKGGTRGPPPPPRPADTAPMEKPLRATDTMPLDDLGSEASSEVHPIKATIDGIYELVADMDPEDVQEIFQIVFEKLPGVELEPAPKEPTTLYRKGAEGRPQVGFKLEELQQLIRRVFRDV
jgi:hypothetical protein